MAMNPDEEKKAEISYKKIMLERLARPSTMYN